MAETAEGLAEKYKLTRKEVDEVAFASQQRAKQAWDACVFQDEVVPVTVKGKKGEPTEYRADEHMRPGTTLEVLLSLKPYFKKDGLVTAGNASGIVDGAAATVIASADYAQTHGLKPLGRLAITVAAAPSTIPDRKSTRLNSSHRCSSSSVLCLKKKKTIIYIAHNY